MSRPSGVTSSRRPFASDWSFECNGDVSTIEETRSSFSGVVFLGRFPALQKCAGSASIFEFHPFISLSSSGVI
jgi:hypothetical protein